MCWLGGWWDWAGIFSILEIGKIKRGPQLVLAYDREGRLSAPACTIMAVGACIWPALAYNILT